MNNQHFTIVVRDANSDLADLENKFFEAGCDDVLLCSYNGTVYLEFAREAETAEIAIESALKSIQLIGYNDLIVKEQ